MEEAAQFSSFSGTTWFRHGPHGSVNGHSWAVAGPGGWQHCGQAVPHPLCQQLPGGLRFPPLQREQSCGAVGDAQAEGAAAGDAAARRLAAACVPQGLAGCYVSTQLLSVG